MATDRRQNPVTEVGGRRGRTAGGQFPLDGGEGRGERVGHGSFLAKGGTECLKGVAIPAGGRVRADPQRGRDIGERQPAVDLEGDDGDISDDEMTDTYDPPVDVDMASPIPRRRPAPRVRTTRVEAPLPSQESIRQPSSKGTDILEKISKTFDPD